MKKLLFGSVILLLFSLSILIIQSSCSKTEAQNSNITQLNKILIVSGNAGVTQKLWSANYDGSNLNEIVFAMPAGVRAGYNAEFIKLSPDGQKIFFQGYEIVSGRSGIYSANLNGSGVVEVIAGDNLPMQYPKIAGAY